MDSDEGKAIDSLPDDNTGHQVQPGPPIDSYYDDAKVKRSNKYEFNDQSIPWKKPEEIKNLIPSVDKFTDDLHCDPYRDWLSDVAYRMQVPADYVAIAAMVVTSSIVGAGCIMRPKARDNWSVTPNLWGAAIGNPSLLKTPSIGEVLRSVDLLQFKYKDIYEVEKSDLEFDAMMNEAQLKELQGKVKQAATAETVDKDLLGELKNEYQKLSEDDVKPTRRLFKTNETSIQSMTVLQESNPRGILFHRDEITGLLTRWDQEQHADERTYFMTGWNGNESYTDHKIGRGLTEAKNVCISLLGTIQPDKLIRYLFQAMTGGNDGLMQRIQLGVWPDAPKDWKNVDQLPDEESKHHAYKILEYLAEVDFIECGAKKDSEDGTPYFRFNDAGQKVFNEWLTELQTVKIKFQDNPLMVQHLGKYRSLMPSLALIFHLIDIADGDADLGGVSEHAACLAVRWCDYLETHARRIYATAESPEHAAAVLLAAKIKAGKVLSPFRASDVYRKCWYGLKDTTEVKGACTILIEESWLYEYSPPKPKTGRTPAPQYYINPDLTQNKINNKTE